MKAILNFFKKYYIIMLAALLVAVLVFAVFYVYGGDGDDTQDVSSVLSAESSEEVSEEDRHYIIDIKDATPYVELGQYKGVEIDFEEVTEDRIDVIRKRALDNVKTFVDTGLPAKNGDTIIIDYEGYNKETGEKFSGGSDKDVTLVLGSAGYINGFESGIVGHEAGETFDVFAVFPDDYIPEDLRGVKAKYTITLKKVTEVSYPEITDELAKKLKYNSAEDLNHRIQVAAQQEVKTANMDKAWKAVVANCKLIKYPEELYNQSVNDFVVYYMDYYKRKAAEYGVELEELLEQTEEELREELIQKGKENANGYVKEETIMYAIALDMGITDISKEDYQDMLQKFANNEGVTTDKLLESYTVEQIKANILWDKVMNYVYENAVQIEEASSEISESSEASEISESSEISE